MRQGFSSTGQPSPFLAALLACLFTLASHCQLRCFVKLWAGPVTHSCCNHGSTPPQGHHSNLGCCRSHHPPPEIRSSMVATPGLSVRAPAAVHVIAPPRVGPPLILVYRALRMTGATVSNAILRI
jgi:hypothetical protein